MYRFTCTLGLGLIDGEDAEDLLDQSTKGLLLNGERRLVTEHDLHAPGSSREGARHAGVRRYSFRNRVYLFPKATLNISGTRGGGG